MKKIKLQKIILTTFNCLLSPNKKKKQIFVDTTVLVSNFFFFFLQNIVQSTTFQRWEKYTVGPKCWNILVSDSTGNLFTNEPVLANSRKFTRSKTWVLK